MSPGRNGLELKNRCLLFLGKKAARSSGTPHPVCHADGKRSRIDSWPFPGTFGSPHEREPIGPTTFQTAASTP